MSTSFSSSTTPLTPAQVQEIIRQCTSRPDKKILQQYSTPFTSNYAPYTQNQLRDLHFNRDCALQWNTFYKNNGRKAYKDRHYILREFPEMKEELDSKMKLVTNSSSLNDESNNSTGESIGNSVRRQREGENHQNSSTAVTTNNTILLLDFGCGVGNLCLPMLDEYRDVLGVVASDLSQVAMVSLQNEISQRSLTNRVFCEQSDLGSEHESKVVPNLCLRGVRHIFGEKSFSSSSSISIFSSLVFVLCSVPETLWKNVVLNIVNSLKGSLKQLQGENHDENSKGYLFFRDYCRDDLAMHRFQSHRAVVAGEDKNNNDSSNNNSDEKVTEDGGSNNNNGNNNSKSSTYMRTNGTLSHFFTLKEVEELFSPYFEILELRTVTLAAPIRDVVSVDFQMNERKFVQAKMLLK